MLRRPHYSAVLWFDTILNRCSAPSLFQLAVVRGSHRTLGTASAPALAARLALNHSTHVEGLLPVLRRVIAAYGPPDIHTIVPGRLAVTRGKANHFRIRISAPTPQGYKALVRRGRTVQEVFFTGSIDQTALQRALDVATQKELGHLYVTTP